MSLTVSLPARRHQLMARPADSVVASGIRCKSLGVVPGSMVMLGDGCDSFGLIIGLGHGGGLWP